MRQIFHLLVLCSLLFSQTLSVLSETVTEPSGATLQLPPGWTRGEATGGASLVLFAPNPSPQFRPNINLLIQETEAMTAQEYRLLSDEQTVQMGGRAENYREITLKDGSVAHSMLIHFSYENTQLTSLSVWVMREGKTYLITGTAETSDFPQRESSFLEVARSFQVQKAPGKELGPLGLIKNY